MAHAAKELRENNDIVIRRADKSDLFVILNRSEYIDKVDSILQDPSKFLRVKKNPIDEIRKKVTKLIDNANADKDGVKFSPLQGHYEPGYFYGNVKTHKPGHKLRPIISQIPTPTYQLAKQLNDLITPYIPTVHALRSTDEFVDLLRNTNPQGILASLDVESLFSNVNQQAATCSQYQRTGREENFIDMKELILEVLDELKYLGSTIVLNLEFKEEVEMTLVMNEEGATIEN
ncbi:uncharacterized protein LOC143025777 [Oratosquilla oratoria]|uniref:uncharacterized protein LOC143025777 n=1 Tax=Oratosquilla oratoria TaxID=337810 RepID=UPI003F7753AA